MSVFPTQRSFKQCRRWLGSSTQVGTAALNLVKIVGGNEAILGIQWVVKQGYGREGSSQIESMDLRARPVDAVSSSRVVEVMDDALRLRGARLLA